MMESLRLAGLRVFREFLLDRFSRLLGFLGVWPRGLRQRVTAVVGSATILTSKLRLHGRRCGGSTVSCG